MDTRRLLGCLEKLQLRFCKYILFVNKYKYNDMVYGELGVLPIKIHIKCGIYVLGPFDSIEKM